MFKNERPLPRRREALSEDAAMIVLQPHFIFYNDLVTKIVQPSFDVKIQSTAKIRSRRCLYLRDSFNKAKIAYTSVCVDALT